MVQPSANKLAGVLLATGMLAIAATSLGKETAIGRVHVITVPLDSGYTLRSATYTPSGKVLVAYEEAADKKAQLRLATMDDDGTKFRPFFSVVLPERPKDNGVRFMVFPDNRRVFLGDFIIECAGSIDDCGKPALLPVTYPPEIADGDHVAHRWSEIIVAPDNRHIAWTTLFANYSAMVFTGKLHRDGAGYRIVEPRIISTTEPFTADPRHPGGVLPSVIRNGEVKQFVNGGKAISLVGAKTRDTADSVLQDLVEGEVTSVTMTPGYDETTIFSPDEKLGITMTSRFSPATDLGVLGLLPRPYPASLNMGLSMHAYTYSVVGVRHARPGNVGPALVELQPSANDPYYHGVNLNTADEWVFHSPMSWHPSGKKAMWLEGYRGEPPAGVADKRIQVVELPDYQPAPAVAADQTPDDIPYAETDMAEIHAFLQRDREVKVRVFGRHSGLIDYARNSSGFIEKTYVEFSDDGKSFYQGRETHRVNPQGESVYRAEIRLTGATRGAMSLQMTFGPLHGALPARLVFDNDEAGVPATRGYTEYDGRRLDVSALRP